MSLDLKERVAAAAKAAGRSMHSEILLRLMDSFNTQESMSLALDPEVREMIEASARAKGVETEEEIRQLLATPVSLTEINHVLLKQIRSDQREILAALANRTNTSKGKK